MTSKRNLNDAYRKMNNFDDPYDDEDDDDEFILDHGLSIEGNSLDDSNNEDEYYEVLSLDEIFQHMLQIIQEVSSVIAIPATTTRILLSHFKWNKEKLLEQYYDGSQEKLFKEAHIINPFKKEIVLNNNSLDNATDECGVCFSSDSTPSMMTGLKCGHKYCTDCWGQYLRVKIMEEGISQTVNCISESCDILVDDATIMRLVKDPETKLKYKQLITNGFVECNRQLKWCPTPGCNFVLKLQEIGENPRVKCKCNWTICFHCSEHWHDPVTCEVLHKWKKKCDEDHESYKWIANNAKPCPRCKTFIQKNGGCNHIRCGNKSCNFDFCWVCFNAWIPHGHHACNAYRDEGVSQDIREKNLLEYEKHKFYATRYLNHKKSLELESKMYKTTILQKMTEMYDTLNMTINEVQFLNKALDTLLFSRLTLMSTYIFASYLKKSYQSIIFEQNQGDLERSTEILSEYLERDITNENLSDIKQKVKDKSRYCESRSKVLLDHVNEGYQKKWWEL